MDKDALFLFGGYALGFISACFFNRPLVRRIGGLVISWQRSTEEVDKILRSSEQTKKESIK